MNVSGNGNKKKKEYSRAFADKQCVARSFIQKCLSLNPNERPTATEALNDIWMNSEEAKDVDLLDTVKENFNPRRVFRSAVSAIKVMNRIRSRSKQE